MPQSLRSYAQRNYNIFTFTNIHDNSHHLWSFPKYDGWTLARTNKCFFLKYGGIKFIIEIEAFCVNLPAGCPKEYVFVRQERLCFKVSTSRTVFQYAYGNCSRADSQLVVLDTPGKHSAVANYVAEACEWACSCVHEKYLSLYLKFCFYFDIFVCLMFSSSPITIVRSLTDGLTDSLIVAFTVWEWRFFVALCGCALKLSTRKYFLWYFHLSDRSTFASCHFLISV